MNTITVTVTADADVSVSVSGCPGPGCQKLTADLERALGRISADERTAEYHQQPKIRTENFLAGGAT